MRVYLCVTKTTPVGPRVVTSVTLVVVELGIVDPTTCSTTRLRVLNPKTWSSRVSGRVVLIVGFVNNDDGGLCIFFVCVLLLPACFKLWC